MQTSALLEWFNKQKRYLLWRSDPNPYYVWVAEVMSQQTSLTVVNERLPLFLEKLPTVKSLSECDEELLRYLWSGLGYYARARNLKKGAILIAQQRKGDFPKTFSEWLEIPGVGYYTAAMISSMSFQEKAAAVDGNIIRVVSRLKGRSDVWTPSGQNKVREYCQSLIKDVSLPGDFNQAFMELGALVCKKRNPECARCPLQKNCFAFQNKETDTLPPIKPKKDKEAIHLWSVIAYSGATQPQYFLSHREKGFLSKTVGFELVKNPVELEKSLKQIYSENIKSWKTLSSQVHHTITHHDITTHLVKLELKNPPTGTHTIVTQENIVQKLGSSLDKKIWYAFIGKPAKRAKK